MRWAQTLVESAFWIRWRSFGPWQERYRRFAVLFCHRSGPKGYAPEEWSATRCLMLAVVELIARCLSLKFRYNTSLIVFLCVERTEWTQDQLARRIIFINAEYQIRVWIRKNVDRCRWSGVG